MKTPVSQAFAQLRTNISLDPVEYQRAIAIHNAVTAYLTAIGLITGAFLQGSLARKTMIAPLRDVDKVVLLAVDYTKVHNGQQIAAEKVAAALKAMYPALEPVIGKHCVALDFGETTFSFDIVPAVPATDGSDDIEIINTKKGGWQTSNTRQLIRVIQERNKDCNGNFIHQARIGKLFARVNAEGLVPGLHVETFGHQAILGHMEDDEAIAALLHAGAHSLSVGVTYTDPTGVDELSHRIDPPARATAQRAFAEAARLADTAVKYRKNGEDNAAIAIWHKMLGKNFPKPDATSALTGLGTGAGIGIGGVVSRTAPSAPTPTRSWRP
jgi:hypothetical protein